MSKIYQKEYLRRKKQPKARFCAGFTLIELLVVVLIIGVLAGIALPQYNKVVFRTKMKNVARLMQSIKRAKDLCKTADPSQPCNTLEELSIGFPCDEETGNVCSKKDAKGRSEYHLVLSGGGAYGSNIYGTVKNFGGELALKNDGKFYCYTHYSSTNTAAEQCRMLGGTTYQSPGYALPEDF